MKEHSEIIVFVLVLVGNLLLTASDVIAKYYNTKLALEH